MTSFLLFIVITVCCCWSASLIVLFTPSSQRTISANERKHKRKKIYHWIKQIEEILFSHSARFSAPRTVWEAHMNDCWCCAKLDTRRMGKKAIYDTTTCSVVPRRRKWTFFDSFTTLFSLVLLRLLCHTKILIAFFRLPPKIAQRAVIMLRVQRTDLFQNNCAMACNHSRWFAAQQNSPFESSMLFDGFCGKISQCFYAVVVVYRKDFLTCVLFLCKNTTFFLHYLFSARRDILSLLLRLHEGRAHGSLVWKLDLTTGVGGSTNGKKKSLLESLRKKTHRKFPTSNLSGAFGAEIGRVVT